MSLFFFLRYEHDVDKIMTQLQFTAADGRPLGVINWFAVHPTSMNNTNRLVSSDNMGYASLLFEKHMNKNAKMGKVSSQFMYRIKISSFSRHLKGGACFRGFKKSIFSRIFLGRKEISD